MAHSTVRALRPVLRTGLRKIRRCFFLLLLALLALGSQSAQSLGQTGAKVSRLGEYRGYSSAFYDGYVRTSTYVPIRDGVRIALDIFRPARNGTPAGERLPVVLVMRRYHRASLRNGKLGGFLPESGPHMSALLSHGYVLACADTRGTGASFGVNEGVYTEAEAGDAFEIIEWLASQPWSNGKVGMTGSSYEGTNQLMAAAKKPPHLKAIMPTMAMFDLYDLAYPGGIYRSDLVKTWSEMTRQLDTLRPPAPVDEDKDGKLIKEALALRSQNVFPHDLISGLKFRDDKDSASGRRIYEAWQPAGFMREIKESGVAICLIGGWYDAYSRDAFLMFRNLGPLFKMIVLDCPHSPSDPSIVPEAINILTNDQLRWFDYWLKGIENGVTGEGPIQFQTNIEGATRTWRSTEAWPLPESKVRSYFFQPGRSGSSYSTNDGRLTIEPPREEEGGDRYTVDYSSTSGEKTRWDNTVAGDFDYGDMSARDAKGLTYTTPPLAEDLEVTGHPVLHLWASSTATDGDFIAFLEEVDSKGASRYVTEGCLRASQRTLGKAPYDNFGLPYHPSAKKDVAPLVPGAPTELVFDLLPTSTIFNVGNRLRITIVCADRDNLATPVLTPAPTVTVYRNAGSASRLDLPILKKGFSR